MKKLTQFFSFLKSVKTEMKKVSWIPRKELFAHTGTVILVVLLLMGFFMFIDYGVTRVLKLF